MGRQNKIPRILYVNSCAKCIGDRLEEELRCGKIDRMENVLIEQFKFNTLEYDVMIIDALDDVPIDKTNCYSKLVKENNPNILIIGTSVMGDHFEQDELARQLYDERITISPIDEDLSPFISKLKEKMERHGFKIPGEHKNK